MNKLIAISCFSKILYINAADSKQQNGIDTIRYLVASSQVNAKIITIFNNIIVTDKK